MFILNADILSNVQVLVTLLLPLLILKLRVVTSLILCSVLLLCVPRDKVLSLYSPVRLIPVPSINTCNRLSNELMLNTVIRLLALIVPVLVKLNTTPPIVDMLLITREPVVVLVVVNMVFGLAPAIVDWALISKLDKNILSFNPARLIKPPVIPPGTNTEQLDITVIPAAPVLKYVPELLEHTI